VRRKKNIAELTGISQPTVNRTIDNFIQNGQLSDLNIFRDFEGDMIVLL